MPIPAANALFHSKPLNNALRSFSFPTDLEARRSQLGQWIDSFQSGTLDKIKKVSLHGQFLTPAEIDRMWNTAPPRMPINRDPN